MYNEDIRKAGVSYGQTRFKAISAPQHDQTSTTGILTGGRDKQVVITESHEWLPQTSQVLLESTGDGFALPLTRVIKVHLISFPAVQAHLH